MKPFYVYLLHCSDGSYYAGQTDDIEARMRQHLDGGIGYTSTRKPVALVWQGEFETREAAIAFEQQIKGWSRAKKEALIRGDWEEIQSLARSRSNSRPEDGGERLRQAQPERLTWIAGHSMRMAPCHRGRSGARRTSTHPSFQFLGILE